MGCVGKLALVEDFFETPSVGFLDGCQKEQLLKISDHYRFNISEKRLKDIVQSILKANLYEMEIFPGKLGNAAEAAGSASLVAQSTALSFVQQKELLLFQMEHEKLKHWVVVEKSEKRRLRS